MHWLLKESYNYNAIYCILTSSAFFLGSIFSVFLSNMFIKILCNTIILKASKKSCVFVYFLLCVASYLKFLHFENILLISQGIIGFSYIIAMTSINKFCYKWINKKNRYVYYSLLTLSPLIGAGIGPVLPYSIFSYDQRLIRKDIIQSLKNL